jgi:hypothetical protein
MEAWHDIRAMFRLARLMGQANTLIEQLVAIAIDGMACDAQQKLLEAGHLSPDEWRQVLREFNELTRFNGMVRALNGGERLMAIDTVTQFASRGDSEFLEVADADALQLGGQVLRIVSVDWNLVLRDTNRFYDSLVKAAGLPDRSSRLTAMDQFQSEINQLFSESKSPVKLLAGVFSRRERSGLVAVGLASFFLPALDAAFDAQDRANARLELTRVAIALAIYRAEQGAYPNKLDDLAPGILDKVPLDFFNSQPFHYSREGNGYLLYSVGENGIDDGGKSDVDNPLIRLAPPPTESPKDSPPARP